MDTWEEAACPAPQSSGFSSADAASRQARREHVDAGGKARLLDTTPRGTGPAPHWRPPRTAERPGQVVNGQRAPPTLHGQRRTPQLKAGTTGMRERPGRGQRSKHSGAGPPLAPTVNNPWASVWPRGAGRLSRDSAAVWTDLNAGRAVWGLWPAVLCVCWCCALSPSEKK